MKKILSIAAIAFCTLAQAQVKMPAPSTTQTIKQDFGMGSLELNYSRPNVKGRKVFGNLVPFNKVWRTGANNATTITVSDEIMIGGVTLKAGKYGILSIPGKKEWTLIITKDVNVTSPAAYKQENDLVRVTAIPMKIKQKAESFTMQFANINYESCELHIKWANTMVSLPITTNIKDRLKADIEKMLQGDKPNYSQAANFYYEWEKDYAKALVNINKAIDANQKAFWLYLTRARIEKESGDKVAAKASAEKCVQLATDAKNDDYIKMGNELIKGL
jgi:tetratricopeptide (TPR) repeat protein